MKDRSPRMRIRPFVLLVASLFTVGCASTIEQRAAQAPPAVAALPTPPPLTPENTLNLDLSTGGRVVIQLRPDKAPNHVERMKTLARRGFYDGLVFHRVIEGFMAQSGDPLGTGEGGSDLPDLNAEFNDLPHVRGTLSAARASDENSANSQFFIMLQPNFRLDRRYTAFGRVVSGMQYVEAIERGEPPANPTRIIKATIGSDPERAPIPQPAPAAPPPPASVLPPAAGGAPPQ